MDMLEPPVELLLVTGPLGAGKTTTVNRLLRAEIESGRRVAVIINEFGSISVDGSLVNADRPEIEGIENLINGCVCCSLRDEVVASLAAWCDLPFERRPQRIVLETTGLADPTDLVDLELETVLKGRLRLSGCLTVVSALTPLDHLQQRTLIRRQVGLASLIHISKADLDPSLAFAWEGQLRTLHQRLPMVLTRMGEAPSESPDPWQGDFQERRPEVQVEGGLSFAEARSLTIHFDHPVDPAALEALFMKPWESGCQAGELLRAKGVVAFDGWPERADGSPLWVFQVADGRMEISPLSKTNPPPDSAAVVIGTALDHGAWKRALRSLERAPTGSRRKVSLQNPDAGT